MNEEKNVWSDDDDFDAQMAKMNEKLSASRKNLEILSDFEDDEKLEEKNEINSENKVKKEKDEINSENKVKKDNRDKFIKIRVTESEKKKIKENAKGSNFTVSDYSRKLILKKKIAKPKYSHEDALMIVTELRETKKALNKIGNNINQIAKLANTNPVLSDEDLNNLARIRFDFDAIRSNLISLNRKTGA